jgi:hypothetical protein
LDGEVIGEVPAAATGGLLSPAIRSRDSIADSGIGQAELQRVVSDAGRTGAWAREAPRPGPRRPPPHIVPAPPGNIAALIILDIPRRWLLFIPAND